MFGQNRIGLGGGGFRDGLFERLFDGDWSHEDQFGFEQVGVGGEGRFDLAEPGLDPAGVAIEGRDVAGLAEDPSSGFGFVALGVFEASVEETLFALLVEDSMAVEHPPVVVEGATGGVGEAAGFLFGAGFEVGRDARRHAVDAGEEAGAAGILGYGRFPGGGTRAGGFPRVGAVGREALFGDVGQGASGAAFGLREEGPGDGKSFGSAVDFRGSGGVHRIYPLYPG
ncbi:hypothetical protein [Paludibaculum fermentans]|uniref:hypothetical protein n=1 Tax=Paludibaculum fermentans TaxID=1473598 RepID=UPI003EBE333F